MRIFPSIPASIVTGAVVMPLCVAGMQFFEALRSESLRFIVQLLWGVLTFFIPVLFSTMDLRRVRERQRELGGNIFTPLASWQDMKQLYFPAWMRNLVLVGSAVLSVLLLQRLGVPI